MYLGSVVPIDIAFPLPFSRAAESTLERTFAACDADVACHSAFPHFRDEFYEVMGHLEGRVLVTVPGHPEAISLSHGRVAEWFRALLYRPSSAARLPWVIHRASKDDWAPIVEGILGQARDADADLSFGLLLSITCSEDVPFVREEEVEAATRGTFLGDWRLRQQQAACKVWPHAVVPANYRQPVHIGVPLMFVSDDDDGGTPVWISAHAAPGFKNRIEVVMSNRGHTDWDSCIARVYERFLNRASVQGLDAYACAHLSRPPFKTK